MLVETYLLNKQLKFILKQNLYYLKQDTNKIK